MKLSIIVCTYNERDTVLTILERVHAAVLPAGWEREVVVVDNASTDGTQDLLRSMDYADTQVVYQPQNMGKGTSVRTAIPLCTGDYLHIQDADLEYTPDDYYLFLDKIAAEHPAAIYGSRTLGGRAIYKYAANYWGVRFLTFLTNLLYGSHLTDVATAAKMVRADVAQRLNLTGPGFDLDFELTDKILRAGYEIAEVPISYKPRTVAEGKKIRPWDGLWALKVIIRDRLLPMSKVVK
ncbi:MAG: glycosyltransferase family 2 protein [Anaerolineae bacterium]|nr:glycosyltransferase family 2 protein [Anaerolineae bacterium]